MRILFISATFPPRAYGGVTAASYHLARHLVAAGHRVTVFTTDYGSRSSRIQDPLDVSNLTGLEIRYFMNVSNSLAQKRLFVPVRMLSELKADLARYDLAHLHDFRSLPGIVLHHYCLKYGIPYVVQAHGSLMTGFQRGIEKSLFDRFWGRSILMDAAKLVATTQAEYGQYTDVGVPPSKVAIIPNGVDTEQYNSLPEKGQLHRRLGLPTGRKLVLFLGRIHRTKGLELLLDAFRLLRVERRDVDLVIAGPDDGYLGNTRRIAQKYGIGENVHFVGTVSGATKLETYVDSDVFVLPSSYEIFGLVLFEAMLCGLPVILTENCGTAPIITENRLGHVVPGGNSEALCRMIAEVLAKPGAERARIERARTFVRSNLAWEIVAGRMAAMYESLLKGGESGA